MDDLVAFLRARLDDDEEWLRVITASAPYQRAAAEKADLSGELGDMLRTVMASPQLQELTARWAASGVRPPNDLDRALREVAAKRAILGEYEAVQRLNASTGQELSPGLRYRGWLLRHLAAVYSGHPGYRDEWKP